MNFIEQYYLEILTFVFLGAGAVVAIIYKTEEGNSTKAKNLKTLLACDIFFGFIVISFISKISNKTQMDRIERLDSLNHSLSIKIDSLSLLNNQIGQRTQQLAFENLELTDSAHEIISAVKDLTISNKKVTALIHKETERQIEENILSGQLFFNFKKLLAGNDLIHTKFGGLNTLNPARFYTPPNPVKLLSIGDFTPIKIFVVNGIMLVSLIAYDLDGNWIMEIDNNRWRRNPNTTGKFNYDSSGFEIVDNRGLIVLNLNLLHNNTIDIRGYLMARDQNTIFVADDKGIKAIGMGEFNWKGEFLSIYKKSTISQLFDYTGKDWIHKRLRR